MNILRKHLLWTICFVESIEESIRDLHRISKFWKRFLQEGTGLCARCPSTSRSSIGGKNAFEDTFFCGLHFLEGRSYYQQLRRKPHCVSSLSWRGVISRSYWL